RCLYDQPSLLALSQFLSLSLLSSISCSPPRPTLFPYTTLFRSGFVEVPLNGPVGGKKLPGADGSFGTGHAQGFGYSFRPTSERRSEEHTSELQSRFDLVCRLLLEKKKRNEANRSHEMSLTQQES